MLVVPTSCAEARCGDKKSPYYIKNTIFKRALRKPLQYFRGQSHETQFELPVIRFNLKLLSVGDSSLCFSSKNVGVSVSPPSRLHNWTSLPRVHALHPRSRSLACAPEMPRKTIPTDYSRANPAGSQQKIIFPLCATRCSQEE